MDAARDVRERLAAGPGRGLGCASSLALEAVQDGGILQGLLDALRDPRARVVARAANALKKAQEREPRVLDGLARALVRVAVRCEVREARWSLLLVVGGLQLTGASRGAAVDWLWGALGSASALERVGAMQGLASLSQQDETLRTRMREVQQRGMVDESAAVRARARRLGARLFSRG